MLLQNIGRTFGARSECDSIRVQGTEIQAIGVGLVPDDDETTLDCQGRLVTPGLIDAHTHPLYAGDRLAEISMRSAGATYQEITAKGGGIASTVFATRQATRGELKESLGRRLSRWLETGTTTIEAKSGYHLDPAGELLSVTLLRDAAAQLDGPDVVPTFLGAHDIPASRDRAEYVQEVANTCVAARSAGASFVDVFCDEGYFTIDETRLILEAGRRAGLGLRLHADELTLSGGATLAGQLGATSADHLLRVDAAGIAALAAGAVVATVCPGTAMAMGVMPPIRSLLDSGVVVALGSDHNPGTCGLTDMTIVVALAVAAFGLSVDEALTAATSGGAQSVGLTDRGTLAPGLRADIVIWDTDHEGAFAWEWGVAPSAVIRAGEVVLGR